MSDPLALVRDRVRAVRTRHLIVAGVFALVGASVWAAPATELPTTGKVAVSLGILGIAAWQAWLRQRVGVGLAVLEAGVPRIVWVYQQTAFINGVEAATGVMIGLETGARHELPTDGPDTVRLVMDHLRGRLPHAAFGYDEVTAKRFAENPASVRAP